ncbi:MAG: Rrf2 family transcriptional regulator [Gammaproteobacteria bacterium]|nr:MAG: Rrf2 family transcriptional regulator [Gammaproteobacteria bacterium]
MQLTRFTDYGLRVLIHLSSQPAGVRVGLDYLAEHFNMNRHHLYKVSQRLSQLGWTSSARGKNGGIVLEPTTRQKNLLEIISELEETMQPIDCKGIQCPIANRCKLQGVLGQAAQAFKNVLAQYQLEDLQQHDLQVIQKVFDVT